MMSMSPHPVLASATGTVLLTARCSMQAPRRCEYTGLLHCPDCQGNDSLPLPALVVKEWDFSARPVSKMVASFLRAIDHQPLLFVSQLNPGLMAR